MPHKENFVKASTNKVMHLGNTITDRYLTYNPLSIKVVFVYTLHFIEMLVSKFMCRFESVHWSLKRFLQTNMGYSSKCWDTMNNMIIIQHNVGMPRFFY